MKIFLVTKYCPFQHFDSLIDIIFFLNFRACEALCQCLPDQLKDDTFSECLKDDKSTKHWLSMLLKNLENMTPGQQGGANQNMNNAIGTYVYLFRKCQNIDCQKVEFGKVAQ